MKNFVLTILILFNTLSGISQQQYLGVNTGVNFAHFSEKQLKSVIRFDYRIGINGGVKFEHILSNNYVLGFGLLYSQQGFIDNGIVMLDLSNNKIADGSYKFYFDYLSLPIKFGYAFGNNIKIIPKIGIQPSYLLVAKTIYTIDYVDDNKVNEITETNITTSTPKIDFAGLIELEFCYDLSDNISLCAIPFAKRSFNKFSGTDVFENSETKHLIFGALVGIKFDISGMSNN